MRDPLQGEATAYEILQIKEDATEADIGAAFKAATRLGGNIGQLTRAWQALKQPGERAFRDLLLYDPDSLRALSPSPLDDPGMLDVPDRAATAAAWEKQLRSRYPDHRAAHSLAVLWYWWALRESHPVTHPDRAGQTEDPPDPVVLWKAAAACWAMLAISEDFWATRPRVSRDLATQLAGRMERMLRERFDSLAMYHRDHGDAAEAERYRSLDRIFTTELRTARALAGSGIRIRGSPVCSGPVLLERLGLSDQVARELDSALARVPGDAELRQVRDALSPYGQISALIEEGQASEALDLITALPRRARGSEEVVSLKARALITLGMQDAELNRIDDAIKRWAQALRVAPGCEQRETARNAIVITTRERAAALAEKDNDQAIALLGKSHDLTGDQALRSILAERLARRGIEAINHASERVAHASRVTNAHKKEVERGTKDLERAAGLGSATAAGQLESARELMRQISVKNVMDQANRAAEQGDWDTAVARLQSAVQTLGGQAPQALRQNLAVAQANRLHKNAEREIDAANRAAEQRDWDTAVAGLRSAIQILGGQAPQALRQNLAVVLANRANKNAEPAMKAFAAARDAAQPDIRAALAIVQRHYRRSPRRVFRWAGAAVSAAIPAGGWILWLTMLSANGWVGAVTWIATIGFFLYIGVSLLRDRGKRAPQRYDSAAPVHCGMCQEPGTYQAELASGAGSPIVLCATHAQMLEGQAGVTIREHTPTRIAAVCCKVCGKAASHEARRGAVEKVSLCASHVRALQRAATSITWRPDPDLARRLGVMLAGPEADLNEAAALAPRLGGVRESLQQLRDLRSRMGLPARR